MPRGGARPGAGAPKGKGRPPPDPALVAEALRLAAETTPEEAAETLRGRGVKVSSRSIRVWQAKGLAQPAVAPPVASVAAAVAAPPPALVIAERPPAGLTGDQQELWIIDHEIEATRNALAKARADGSTRTAPLQSELYDLLDRRRKLRAQAEPADPHAAEKQWRAAADAAKKKISDGVEKAQKRMAALLGTPFRDAYLVACRPAASPS